MTIQVEKEKVSLRLTFDDGIVDGKQKLKSKSYNRIKETAGDENLFKTGQVLAGLQDKDLELISKIEVSSLLG